MRILNLALLLSCAALLAAGPSKATFHGEISDSQCAMNVHSLSRSHQEMIAKNTFGSNAESCARTCVRRGGEWVLRSGDNVYHLKNQDGVDLYSGKRVCITGILDSKTKIIDNMTMETESSMKPVKHSTE
jgi:hypothetical protein